MSINELYQVDDQAVIPVLDHVLNGFKSL